MNSTDHEFEYLVDAAAAAYGRVRLEIVDRIPSPARIDPTRLDVNQRWAWDELRRAEADLADYRQRCYA